MEQGSFWAESKLTSQRELFDERRHQRSFVFKSMRFRHRSTSKPSIAGVDASNESRLLFARAVESKIGQQFHVTIGDIGKGLRSSAGIRCRHVCHAIVRNAFLDIHGIKMRGRSRCLRTAARSEEHTSEL